MVCQGLEIFGTETGFVELLAFPGTCNYYFWAIILGFLFVILTMVLYNKEREEFVKSDIISSLGVSALAIVLLALPLTLTDPQILQQDLYLYMIAFATIFIGLWLFKK